MNKIHLNNLNLKTLTEQNILDYCLLNNINLSDIEELDLGFNYIVDISEIKIFKNIKTLILNNNLILNISVLKNLKYLEKLYIGFNKIKDISLIQYLNNLYELDINNLILNLNQIQYINKCKNLKILWCYKGFKENNSIISKQLNNNIEIYSYEYNKLNGIKIKDIY